MDNIRGTKINFNPINILKLYKYILEDIYPILLGHHPSCKRYNSDVFIIGGLRLCIGCSVMYPTFILSTMIITLLFFFGYVHWYLLLILTPIFYSTLALKYLGVTSLKPVKALVAFYLGIGLACFLWGALFTPYGVFFLIPLFMIVNIAVAYSAKYRKQSFYKKCKKCAYKMNWVRCPGMKDIIKKLDADGFDMSRQFKYKFE